MTTKPPYDEKNLLSRIAQGDEIAFSLLFYSWHNKLGAFILRLTHSTALTQEIVQDVFLRIWQNRNTLTEVENFDSWLFVIARNHAFNCLKKIAREKVRKLEWEKTVSYTRIREEAEAVAPPYEGLIDKAIEELPPQQKKVYILHNQEGMCHSEIASQLGLSQGTVKKHMSLALRSIREYVSTHMDPVSVLLVLLLQLFLRR